LVERVVRLAEPARLDDVLDIRLDGKLMAPDFFVFPRGLKRDGGTSGNTCPFH
jgi:hypothetical protein